MLCALGGVHVYEECVYGVHWEGCVHVCGVRWKQ